MSNITGQWVSVKKGGFPKLADGSGTKRYRRVYCTFISKYTGGTYAGYLEYEGLEKSFQEKVELIEEDFAPWKWRSAHIGISCEPDEVLAWFIMPRAPDIKYFEQDDETFFRLVDDLTDDAAEVKLPE